MNSVFIMFKCSQTAADGYKVSSASSSGVRAGRASSVGDSVLSQTGEPANRAAARGPAGHPHVTGFEPPIACSMAVLDLISGGDAVKAPCGKEMIVNHGDAKIAAGGGGAGGSTWMTLCTGVGTVGLGALQTRVASKATKDKT